MAVRLDGVRRTAMDLLSLPGIELPGLTRIWPELADFGADIVEQLEIDAQYAGYLDRQDADILAFRQGRGPGPARTSTIAHSRAFRPRRRRSSAASAPPRWARPARIDGVTPAALTLVLAHVRPGARPSACLRPFGPEEFAATTGVSRETLARLKAYVGLLEDWNARHNLVSAGSLADVWRRHVWDSAQLAPLHSGRQRKTLVDLGSGAGFPGLVLAESCAAGLRVTLFEATAKKCRFPGSCGPAHGPECRYPQCPDRRCGMPASMS